MVTFIDLNTTNKDRETVNAVKKAFDYVFRYTCTSLKKVVT